jgi:geranylgeranyl pyrophosphate synthase
VLHALDDPVVGSELRSLLTAQITMQERDCALNLIRETSGVTIALDIAQSFADKAAGALSDLPDTPGAAALRAASDDLIARAHAPLS